MEADFENTSDDGRERSFMLVIVLLIVSVAVHIGLMLSVSDYSFTPLVENVHTDRKLTKDLDAAIACRFHKTLDADLVLYLGLCNGAGWVTTVSGKTTILFGIEKIMELNWQDPGSMTGLIYHELGHVYQAQYGVLNRDGGSLEDQFLWQLFTEGIAMVFEQELVGDPDSFHQYNAGWKRWCRSHLDLIKRSFYWVRM